jgi:hypothetical protein
MEARETVVVSRSKSKLLESRRYEVKRFSVVLSALLLTVASAQTPPPEALYSKATVKQTLEIIGKAHREVYLLLPSLRNPDVYNALRSRIAAGVVLRLLIADKAGYTGFEVNLRELQNVDARWLPERIGGAILIVDDAALVQGSVVSGLSSSGTSIAVTRPELVPAMSASVKQLFARARKVK